MSSEYKSEVGNTQGLLAKGSVFFIILAILVGAGSFGLGRLTKISDAKEPIVVEKPTQVAGVETIAPPIVPEREIAGTTTGQFVASKNGKKYFTVGCSAAKTIKEENKVYFGSQDEAKKAGYEASTMCKDLN